MSGVVTGFDNPQFLSSDMRTILHGSSCDLLRQNQHNTPHSVLRCLPLLNLPCASSQRPGLIHFQLLRSPQHSAIVADFLVWFYQIRIRIRICPNRCASSNTHSLCDPSNHNTSIPSRPLLADSRCCFDFPCSRRVRNCYRFCSCQPPPRPRGISSSVYNILLSACVPVNAPVVVTIFGYGVKPSETNKPRMCNIAHALSK